MAGEEETILQSGLCLNEFYQHEPNTVSEEKDAFLFHPYILHNAYGQLIS